MAFFKKLKERLFKSSSKLDEGLEAIVEDGGEVSEAEVELAPSGPSQAELDAQRIAAERAEQERLEQERLVQEAEARAAAERAEAERLAQEAAEAARRAAEDARVEADRLAQEQAAQAAQEEQTRAEAEAREAARKDAELQAAARAADAERAADIARQEARAAEQAEVEKAAAERAQADRLAAERADAERQAAEHAQTDRLAAEKAEADRAAVAKAEADHLAAAQAEAERLAAVQAEAERVAAEQAEATRKAEEEARRVAEHAAAQKRAVEIAEQQRRDEDAAQQQAAAAKPGLLGRLFGRKEKKTVLRRTLDDDMLEQLEELLITADMGVDTALRVTANMAEGRYGKKLSVQEIKELMAQEIARIMEPVAKPLPIYPKTPQVVLVVGVNGSGKTTTIGKLASQFRAAGKKVVIAAGDTFRAAAVEQLQVWGDRAGVPVLTAPEGSDPASLAFDAMEKATRDGADLLMIDTAGRLQNRSDLMEELAKIVRVIRKQDATAPHNTLLVLDATTGQNALNQVKIFQEVSDVSGLVMTKLDGTAKGGVLVALADKFGLPIHAIGVGEQIDDLAPFDPEEFAAALTGLETE